MRAVKLDTSGWEEECRVRERLRFHLGNVVLGLFWRREWRSGMIIGYRWWRVISRNAERRRCAFGERDWARLLRFFEKSLLWGVITQLTLWWTLYWYKITVHYTVNLHLADAFIQSDSAFRLYIFCQYVCSLGIEPTTFVLLTQCSNHWATGTVYPCKYTWIITVQCGWRYICFFDILKCREQWQTAVAARRSC